MTRTRRLAVSYLALAAALAVLFALNLFWGSVSLAPGAVVAALLGKGQDTLSMNIILQLRLPRAVMAALLGAALVTCAEFFSGLLLNLALRWDIWDYSGLPGNLLGQVCLLYAALWVPLSGAGILLSGMLDRLCRRQAALRRSRRRAGGR